MGILNCLRYNIKEEKLLRYQTDLNHFKLILTLKHKIKKSEY